MASEPPSPPAPAAVIESLGTLRVLLVEDNRVNQVITRRLLEKADCQVHVASNGKDAVLTLEGGQFDLVLMDVQMPVMDGLEATRTIRAREQPGATRIPIIALTAHAMREDEEKCLQAGMDGYVSKPLRISALFDAIKRVRSNPNLIVTP